MTTQQDPSSPDPRRLDEWGDTRQPFLEPETATPERGPSVERDAHAALRDNVALHRIQALHTPFKAVDPDEYRRLEERAAAIERRFVTDPEMRDYAGEVYEKMPVRRSDRREA